MLKKLQINNKAGKQAALGGIISIIGVVLGFLNAGLLQPLLLERSQIGQLKLFTSLSSVLGIIGLLGFEAAVNRAFPYYKTKDGSNNGFYYYSLAFGLFGVVLSVLILFIGQDYIFSGEGAEISWLFPLLLITVVFRIFLHHLDALFTQLGAAILGVFYLDIVQRLLIIASLILFFIDWIDFPILAVLFGIALCLPGFIMLVQFFPKLLVKGALKPVQVKGFGFKKIAELSWYGYLSSISSYFLRELDFLMISYMLSLHFTGIYTVLFFFGSLVQVPAKVLLRVVLPLIGDAWKENKLVKIQQLYTSSSIVMFMIGVVVLGGIIVGIDYVMQIMPSGLVYQEYKWVAIIIGAANLVNMFFGVNAQIIGTSEKYKMNFYFNLILLINLFVFNYFMISWYSIIGFALGTFLAIAVNNLLRYLYLRKVFGFHFVEKTHLYIFFAFIISIAASAGLKYLLPVSELPIGQLLIVEVFFLGALAGCFKLFKLDKYLYNFNNSVLQKRKKEN